MFARACKEILRCERGSHGIISRSVVKSTTLLSNHNVSDKMEDIAIRSPRSSLTYPDQSLDQFVWDNLTLWGKKVAMVDGISDRFVTYDQLRDKCRALAIRLYTSLSLKTGDTIAVCFPNSIEFPTICLAGNEAGMVVTTVNPIYTAEEMANQLINSEAKVLFGYAKMSSVLLQAVKLSGRPMRIVYAKASVDDSLPADGINLDELTTAKGIDLSVLKPRDRDPLEVSVLPYSSGTTGLSKGVQLSHKNIIADCLMINDICGLRPAMGDHQEILLNILPFFHIYGFTGTLISKLATGCKIITLPKFTPETYLNILVKHRISLLHLVPPIIIFLNSHDRVEVKHMESVRLVVSGAAPIGASDLEKLSLKSPSSLFVQGYGLTEASPVTHLSTPGSTNYASIGHLLQDTEGKIVHLDDPEGLGVGPNIKGELWVRGPQVMIGYHNNEQATKDTVTADGWLRTGDIGYYDENQEFYITDRLKELIKVKGFQVPPAELEEVLRNHPDITDAGVIGIPHPTAGETPRAYVVSKNPNLTENEVKKYVAQKVAEYKRLEGGVEFLGTIPKSETGKILRRSLKLKFESA